MMRTAHLYLSPLLLSLAALLPACSEGGSKDDACTLNTDCPTGKLCDPATRRCVSGSDASDEGAFSGSFTCTVNADANGDDFGTASVRGRLGGDAVDFTTTSFCALRQDGPQPQVSMLLQSARPVEGRDDLAEALILRFRVRSADLGGVATLQVAAGQDEPPAGQVAITVASQLYDADAQPFGQPSFVASGLGGQLTVSGQPEAGATLADVRLESTGGAEIVGAPCSSDADCDVANGIACVAFFEGQGGFCTTACRGQAECDEFASGTACVPFLADGSGFCFSPCGHDVHCGEGLTCQDIAHEGPDACAPEGFPAFDEDGCFAGYESCSSLWLGESLTDYCTPFTGPDPEHLGPAGTHGGPCEEGACSDGSICINWESTGQDYCARPCEFELPSPETGLACRQLNLCLDGCARQEDASLDDDCFAGCRSAHLDDDTCYPAHLRYWSCTNEAGCVEPGGATTDGACTAANCQDYLNVCYNAIGDVPEQGCGPTATCTFFLTGDGLCQPDDWPDTDATGEPGQAGGPCDASAPWTSCGLDLYCHGDPSRGEGLCVPYCAFEPAPLGDVQDPCPELVSCMEPCYAEHSVDKVCVEACELDGPACLAGLMPYWGCAVANRCTDGNGWPDGDCIRENCGEEFSAVYPEAWIWLE